MAKSIKVVGATTLTSTGGTLGQTDDNNDISIQIMPGEKKIHTNQSGPHIPAKVISLGEYATIRVPLIDWDDAVIDAIRKRQTSTTTNGQLGTLGTDLTQFPLNIVTTRVGERSFAFPNTRLVDTVTIEKFGYEPERLMLVFEAIPDPAALGTATTPLYTVSTNS
jgi:hypothetical protein